MDFILLVLRFDPLSDLIWLYCWPLCGIFSPTLGFHVVHEKKPTQQNQPHVRPAMWMLLLFTCKHVRIFLNLLNYVCITINHGGTLRTADACKASQSFAAALLALFCHLFLRQWLNQTHMHKFGSICSRVSAKKWPRDLLYEGLHICTKWSVSFFQKWKSWRLCWSRPDPLKGIVGLVSWKKGALIIPRATNKEKVIINSKKINKYRQTWGGKKTTCRCIYM